MTQAEEITATYLGDIFRRDDFVIANVQLVDGSAINIDVDVDGLFTSDFDPLDPDPNNISIKGTAEPEDLVRQQTYRWYGHWGMYKDEKQFSFSGFVRCQPHSREGIISYLKIAGKGRGIGPVKATKLWEVFGSDAVKTLRVLPEVASDAVKTLNLEQATEAAEWLVSEQRLENCMIDVIGLLSGRGFPNPTARSAVKEWKNSAANIIERDPYALMDFRGCGWVLCDNLYLDMGLPPKHLRRQVYCCWYTVASNRDGHTWFPVKDVIKGLYGFVGSGSKVRPARAIKMALRLGRVSPDRHGALSLMRSSDEGAIVQEKGNVYLAEGRSAWAEEKLARCIVDSQYETPQWPCIDHLDLEEHQIEQLGLATKGVVGILGGGPGCGKTYTAARLIAECIKKYGVHKVAVGAPTGKAAVRISEAMVEHGIKVKARTWHSLLGVGSQSISGGWGFEHNEQNPFDYKVIVGDESSMNDTGLMSSIFRARAKGTHILLVGDVNQLAPVGHGAPLRDLIAAGLPYGELTEIHRNSGGIVEACHQIRQGKPWAAGDNLIIKHSTSEEDTLKEIIEIITDVSIAEKLDPIWDFQVVCAMNDKTTISRVPVNKMLQSQLNPNPIIKGCAFRELDKIVNLKNDRFRNHIKRYEHVSNDGEPFRDEVYVANGELAEVIQIQPKKLIVKLTSPDRTIEIPFGKQKIEKGTDGIERESTGCSWDLGYALTVHKAQGSEWPVVIVVIDDAGKRVCSREWIYTAISRAKKRCFLVGKKSTADSFCRYVAIGQRKTFLREQILRMQAERVLVDL